MLTGEFNSYHIATMPFSTEFLRFIVISFNCVCVSVCLCGVCALECRCPPRSEALPLLQLELRVAGACYPPNVGAGNQSVAICKSSTCS